MFDGFVEDAKRGNGCAMARELNHYDANVVYGVLSDVAGRSGSTARPDLVKNTLSLVQAGKLPLVEFSTTNGTTEAKTCTNNGKQYDVLPNPGANVYAGESPVWFREKK